MRLAEIVKVKDNRKTKIFSKTPRTPTTEELAGISKDAKIKSVEELAGIKKLPGEIERSV